MSVYKKRISLIQNSLNNLDGYLILSADCHLNEYLPEHFKIREFLSGFDGSYAVLLILKHKAYLWTDGRYYLQAEKQLKDSGIILQKQNKENTYLSFLKEQKNFVLGIDFRLLAINIKEELEKINIKLVDIDLISNIWENRATLPKQKVFIHDIKYAINSTKEKLTLIKEALKNKNCTSTFISSLDDIAYILNLRGSDIAYNPVFLSHLLITNEKSILFIDEDKINEEIKELLLKDNIFIMPYESAFNELSLLRQENILIDSAKCVAYFLKAFHSSVKITYNINISTLLKACKNDEQIKHIKDAMLFDAIALSKFYFWLENEYLNNNFYDENELSDKLTQFRAQNDLYLQDSFTNIIAMNENAALPHYKAKDNPKKMQKNTLLLIDSGAQYLNGTTDITRVSIYGQSTKEQRIDYTLVLKAHIAISSTIFPKDIALPLLDSITRAPLWKEGIDFMHGTGHGVGYCLNVHEGPNVLSYYANINENMKAKLGMISSIEPGIYRANKWGIRLENLVYIKEAFKSEFAQFYKFENLTLFFFEKDCIEISLLNEAEKEWINNYHKEVFLKLKNHFEDEKILKWLEKKCEKI